MQIYENWICKNFLIFDACSLDMMIFNPKVTIQKFALLLVSYLNPLHAELFPGHCSVMLDNICNVSNILIRNFKCRFHQEEVCQFEIKGYEICSEITEIFFS